MSKEYQGSLFYNYPSFQDTLFIVIDNSKMMTSFKRSGDVVGIYYQDELIGVNIFNSNNFLKFRLDGLLHNPNEPLVDLVGNIIYNSLKERVVVVGSPVILGKINSIKNDKVFIELGDEKVYKAGCRNVKELSVGSYVLASKKGTRLDDGNMSDDFLKNDEEYLIVGLEENDIDDDAYLGQQAYDLKKQK